MKHTIYILTITLFSTVTFYGQNTIDSSLLNGEWAGKEVVDINDDYKVIIGTGIVADEATHVLQFLTVSTLSFKENNVLTTHTYNLTDDKLIFDNKQYLIVELSTDRLKLKKIGGTSNHTLYFDKIESGGY